MATTTTNFGWDIPQSTDLVKDGATAIAALGQDIDTALVDLKGGTTNQYLTKQSATDLDFQWTTNTAVTSATPLKSAQSYRAWGSHTNSNGILNTVYYLPIVIPSSVTLDRISVSTSTGFSGTGAVRLGIYNMDGTGLPSTVLLDAGTVSVTAASTTYSITISQAITPGIYFLAAVVQTAATTNGFIGVVNLYAPILPMTNTTSTAAPIAVYTQTGVSGAFATAVSPVGNAGGGNNISAFVRVA